MTSRARRAIKSRFQMLTGHLAGSRLCSDGAVRCYLVGFASLACLCARTETDWTWYVRPEVGTHNSVALSHGNLYPSFCVPWGMHAWAPQSRPGWKDGWFYEWEDDRIYGIRQTHQPSPWMGDYGAWSILPVSGRFEPDASRRWSWISHAAETMEPAYYRAYLANYDVTFELAPTSRAAEMRVTYGATDSPGFVIDSYGGRIAVEGDRGIRGVNTRHQGVRSGVQADFANHFVIEFDCPFVESIVTNGLAYVRFSRLDKSRSICVRTASSFISDEQARRNLREVADRGFDDVRFSGRKEWNERLGRIAVKSTDIDRLRMFYTCLYRSLQFPRVFYEIDADGRAVHYSPAKGGCAPGRYFAGTGFWDTFRALYPLLTFIYPEVVGEMLEGLECCWKESGWLPEWSNPGLAECMIGNNSASVVADAILAGVPGNYDAGRLYEALVHGAENAHPTNPAVGRLGVNDYMKRGYVPRDIGIDESVARTLEYAYADFCIARLGKHLGRPQDEIERFARRAGNWRTVFDQERRLAVGRNSDGSFNPGFNPYSWGGDFTEGNSLHYTWSVFHDIPGLIATMGGRDAFVKRLEGIFHLPPVAEYSYYGSLIHEILEMQIADFGQYAHGNQPAQHLPYLFALAGAPERTRHWVREVMDRLYHPTPDGYCGDEDNGQTSAWYVWSALGFYPVCPVAGEYVLGAPVFDEIKVSVPGRFALRICSKNRSDSFCIYFNGHEILGPVIRRTDLAVGGNLDFGGQGRSVCK